jgi:hypothetical protein
LFNLSEVLQAYANRSKRPFPFVDLVLEPKQDTGFSRLSAATGIEKLKKG